ncbi:hypothetical protein ACLBXZ_30600, partial [Methylobacterium fujisawaense]
FAAAHPARESAKSDPRKRQARPGKRRSRGRSAADRSTPWVITGRLKDFRRIATRYDRLATNYLAAVCLAATVSYWL